MFGSVGVCAALERTRHEIALLREHRTCLVADVVAGKLDVREVAARFPEEADEPEPLDEVEAESALGDDGDEVCEEAEA